jgi:cytochrome d ubiquinol oxidase subunit II
MVGIFGVFVVAMQGASYAAMKTTGNVQERARKALRLLRFVFPALLAVLAALTYVYVPGAYGRPIAWVGIALAVAFWAAMFIPRLASDDRTAFLASSAMTGSLWAVAGAVLFPNLVAASNDAASSLTIYNASSPEVTMWAMLVVTVVGLPFVLVYTVYVYRVFKGKVAPGMPAPKAG